MKKQFAQTLTKIGFVIVIGDGYGGRIRTGAVL